MFCVHIHTSSFEKNIQIGPSIIQTELTHSNKDLHNKKGQKIHLNFVNCYEFLLLLSLNYFEQFLRRQSKKEINYKNIEIKSAHCNQIECRTIYWTIKKTLCVFFFSFSFWVILFLYWIKRIRSDFNWIKSLQRSHRLYFWIFWVSTWRKYN